MEGNNFDLTGFLNSPQAQANKPAAIQYLQSKGIVDSTGKPIPGMSKQAPAPVATPAKSSGVSGFVKSLVSPTATLLARPIQAVAELAGASDEQVNAATKKIAGDVVAPVPENGADVKKDVGRGIETVALGAGPEAPALAGAAFGAGSSIEQGNDIFGLKTAFDAVLGAAGGKVLDLVGKPLFNIAGKVVGEITPDYLAKIASQGTKAIQDFAASHEIVPQIVRDATDAVGNKISDVATTAKQAVKDELPSFTRPARTITPADSLKANIDAVNPDLTGNKLVGAYKQVVTGDRGLTPASIFDEQSLTPNQRSITLGTRLHNNIALQDGTEIPGIKLTGDHVSNLNTLAQNLDSTESKLTAALKGDPEINFNADKPTLMTMLEDAKTNAPREFSSIKESKSVYDNVIDFAKEQVQKAEDSIIGLRDARTAFDARAKVEYPSAFKDGAIDTKTPAGQAIKQARDLMSKHLYDTAPNGSDIKALIAREADIFRASDSVASKAAKGDAKTSLAKWIKDNPRLAKALGYGFAGSVLGGDFILHKLGI